MLSLVTRSPLPGDTILSLEKLSQISYYWLRKWLYGVDSEKRGEISKKTLRRIRRIHDAWRYVRELEEMPWLLLKRPSV